MRTPWGESDRADQIAEGVWEVGTPSHGGILVHDSMAGFLGAEGRAVGERFGEWLAFEEDCAYAAVYAAMPALWRASVNSGAVLPNEKLDGRSSDEEIGAHFLKTCHLWFPDAYGGACQRCEEEHHGLCRDHGGREALWARGLFLRCSAINEGSGVRVTFEGPDHAERTALVSTETYRRWPLLVLVTEADYGVEV